MRIVLRCTRSADFTAALRLDSDFIDGYEARAEAFLAKTDPEHAIADLDQAIRRDPNRARDYYLRGSIRYDRYMGFLGGGWIEKEDIYLDSDNAFAVTQKLARDQGDCETAWALLQDLARIRDPKESL